MNEYAQFDLFASPLVMQAHNAALSAHRLLGIELEEAARSCFLKHQICPEAYIVFAMHCAKTNEDALAYFRAAMHLARLLPASDKFNSLMEDVSAKHIHSHYIHSCTHTYLFLCTHTVTLFFTSEKKMLF